VIVRNSWQMFTAALDDEVVTKIVESAGPTDVATTFNTKDFDVAHPDNVEQVSSIRSSRVSWLNNQPWVLDMLYFYVDLANQSAFKVNVNKKAEIQYTEYHADQGGHYGLHHDIDWNRNDGFDRKLSVTVQLSDPFDYEGGGFEFTETESPMAGASKAKGTVLIFPSYLQHKVKPITKGVRRSLVAWFEGPQWV
jgi:PKHD-type hydroxylase